MMPGLFKNSAAIAFPIDHRILWYPSYRKFGPLDTDRWFKRTKSLLSFQAPFLHRAFLSLIVKWSAAKWTLEYRFVSDRDLFKKTPSEIKESGNRRREGPTGAGEEIWTNEHVTLLGLGCLLRLNSHELLDF